MQWVPTAVAYQLLEEFGVAGVYNLTVGAELGAIGAAAVVTVSLPRPRPEGIGSFGGDMCCNECGARRIAESGMKHLFGNIAICRSVGTRVLFRFPAFGHLQARPQNVTLYQQATSPYISRPSGCD